MENNISLMIKILINECECFPLWVLPGFIAFVNCLISFGIIFMVLFFFLFLITVISYLLKPQTSIYINSLPVFKIITFCVLHIRCLFSSVLPLSRLKKFLMSWILFNIKHWSFPHDQMKYHCYFSKFREVTEGLIISPPIQPLLIIKKN